MTASSPTSKVLKASAASIAASQLSPVVDPVAERRRQEEQAKLWTVVVGATAGITLVTALMALYIEASVAAYAAFVLPLVTAPYTIHQRRQLNKLPTLEQEINNCRVQVNALAQQNGRLHKEIDALQVQTQRLQAANEQLDVIAKRTGENADELRQLVYENGETQRQIKKLQQARELQTMLTAILQSDVNGDAVLSPSETDQLVMRLQVFTNARPEQLRQAFMRASMKQAHQSQPSTTTLFRHLSNSMDEHNQTNSNEADSFGYFRCVE